MPSYQYRYVDDQGSPLLQCPRCGTRWDINHGITLDVIINDMKISLDTQLDENGYLIDVEDLVKNGYHSGTYCGDCGELLMDLPGVTEIRDIILSSRADAIEVIQPMMDEADKAFENLRNNPDAWAEEQAERKLWEGTLLDDIEGDD